MVHQCPDMPHVMLTVHRCFVLSIAISERLTMAYVGAECASLFPDDQPWLPCPTPVACTAWPFRKEQGKGAAHNTYIRDALCAQRAQPRSGTRRYRSGAARRTHARARYAHIHIYVLVRRAAPWGPRAARRPHARHVPRVNTYMCLTYSFSCWVRAMAPLLHCCCTTDGVLSL